jgi:hypothetical protein
MHLQRIFNRNYKVKVVILSLVHTVSSSLTFHFQLFQEVTNSWSHILIFRYYFATILLNLMRMCTVFKFMVSETGAATQVFMKQKCIQIPITNKTG